MRCGNFRLLFLVGLLAIGSLTTSVARAAEGTTPPEAGLIPALVQPSITYLDLHWRASIYVSHPEIRGLIAGGEQIAETQGHCSGFFVSPNGHVMTASHCTEFDDGTREGLIIGAARWALENGVFGDATPKFVIGFALKYFRVRKPELTTTVAWSYTADGSDVRNLPARQIGNRPFLKGDVALLRINADHTIPLRINTQEVEIKQPVDSVGFPGLVDDVTDADKINPNFEGGEISAKKTILQGLHEVYGVNTELGKGMSGGPTVTDDGSVVGVNSFGVSYEGETYNFVSPSAIADELLQDKGVSPRTSPASDLLHEGITALYEGDRSEALDALEEVIEREPDWAMAATYRAQALALPKEDTGLSWWAIVLIAVGGAVLLGGLIAILWRRGKLTMVRIPRPGAAADRAPGPAKTVTGDGSDDLPSVYVVSGRRAGERIPVSGEVSIGRVGADITVDDDEVSRKHAVIRRAGNDLEIHDAGSSNGTFVNGERIDGSRRLSHGDSIRVGKTTLEVSLPGRRALVSEDIPTLVIKGGSSEGKRFPIDRERSIGRETADIIIDDVEISRRHATVRPVEGGLEISDLQSSNGTFVNGNRINGGHRLSAGDVIRMGATTLEVEMPTRASGTVVRGATVVRTQGE